MERKVLFGISFSFLFAMLWVHLFCVLRSLYSFLRFCVNITQFCLRKMPFGCICHIFFSLFFFKFSFSVILFFLSLSLKKCQYVCVNDEHIRPSSCGKNTEIFKRGTCLWWRKSLLPSTEVYFYAPLRLPTPTIWSQSP